MGEVRLQHALLCLPQAVRRAAGAALAEAAAALRAARATITAMAAGAAAAAAEGAALAPAPATSPLATTRAVEEASRRGEQGHAQDIDLSGEVSSLSGSSISAELHSSLLTSRSRSFNALSPCSCILLQTSCRYISRNCAFITSEEVVRHRLGSDKSAGTKHTAVLLTLFAPLKQAEFNLARLSAQGRLQGQLQGRLRRGQCWRIRRFALWRL